MLVSENWISSKEFRYQLQRSCSSKFLTSTINDNGCRKIGGRARKIDNEISRAGCDQKFRQTFTMPLEKYLAVLQNIETIRLPPRLNLATFTQKETFIKLCSTSWTPFPACRYFQFPLKLISIRLAKWPEFSCICSKLLQTFVWTEFSELRFMEYCWKFNAVWNLHHGDYHPRTIISTMHFSRTSARISLKYILRIT